MIHKITCKVFGYMKYSKILSAQRPSKDLRPADFFVGPECSTRATGVQYSKTGFLLSLKTLNLSSQIWSWTETFAWLCVVVQMMRFISVELGGSQNRGENWPDSSALVLTMQDWSGVSPIGDIWIDTCPLYEANPDSKPSFKKTRFFWKFVS